MSDRLQEGQRWGYLASRDADLVEVQVLQVADTSPPRVLIRFLDVTAVISEEWVPPRRLKVLWADADAWISRISRTKAAAKPFLVAGADTTHEFRAAKWVLEALNNRALHPGYSETQHGLLVCNDIDALPAEWELTRPLMLADPESFDDDGTLVGAWPALPRVAEHLAARCAPQLLATLDEEARELRHNALHGRHFTQGTYNGFIPPEYYTDAAEAWGPFEAVVRKWCGAPAVERHDELVALRAEVLRLDNLITTAVAALREADRCKEADELERAVVDHIMADEGSRP